MPLDAKCPNCQRKFRVSEKYAGKRVKCPKCQTAIGIPSVEGTGGTPQDSPQTGDEAAGAADEWFMQTRDGEQYGPATKAELDDWLAEGRVDNSCQLLCEGWQQWKWAEEVYPELKEAEANEAGFPGIQVDDGKAKTAGKAVDAPAVDVPSVAQTPAVEPVEPDATVDQAPLASVTATTRRQEYSLIQRLPRAKLNISRRRAYPALVTTAKIYTFMAWIVAILGGIAGVVLAVVFLVKLGDAGLAETASFLAAEVGIGLYTFLGVVTLKAAAEFISLAMHIEHDNHVSSDALVKLTKLLSKDK